MLDRCQEHGDVRKAELPAGAALHDASFACLESYHVPRRLYNEIEGR